MSTNFSVLLNDFTRSNPSMQSINSTYISGSPKLLILLNDILHKISTLQFNPNRSPLHKFYLMHYSILIRLPTFTPYFEDKIIFPYFNYLFCLITYIRLPKLEIYFHFLSSFFFLFFFSKIQYFKKMGRERKFGEAKCWREKLLFY